MCTDRPTITYAPITGSDFNKNFLTPIPPSAMLFLIQAGWPAKVFMPIALETINGLRAQKSLGAIQRRGEDDFYRVIELFDQLQQAGALGMRVEVDNSKGSGTTILAIRGNDLPAAALDAGAELRALLGLDAEASEFEVAFGEVAQSDTELAIVTRSTLSIMLELAGHVRVPAADIEEGRTEPSRFDRGDPTQREFVRLIDVRHSAEPPADAFVAVRYRDLWFWVDDRDFRSKRTLAYLMLVFSLTESGGREGLPLVTIPAG